MSRQAQGEADKPFSPWLKQVYATARRNIDAEYTIETQKAEAKIDSSTGERYLLINTTISINGAKSVLSYKYII